MSSQQQHLILEIRGLCVIQNMSSSKSSFMITWMYDVPMVTRTTLNSIDEVMDEIMDKIKEKRAVEKRTTGSMQLKLPKSFEVVVTNIVDKYAPRLRLGRVTDDDVVKTIGEWYESLDRVGKTLPQV